MDVDWRGTRPLILLAEDEAIIAVELQESLSDSGFSVVGPFATCAEAEAWLKTGTPGRRDPRSRVEGWPL